MIKEMDFALSTYAAVAVSCREVELVQGWEETQQACERAITESTAKASTNLRAADPLQALRRAASLSAQHFIERYQTGNSR